LTQTKKQQDSLTRKMGYPSVIANLPYVPYGDRRNLSSRNRKKISVIWVGRLIDLKRPGWVIELAARCPNLHFDIVGPEVGSSELVQMIKRQANASPNVTLHGRVSEERLHELFGTAFALCCTSTIEGFPTTFLEAWYFGLPIVTTFDPDDLVASNQLGFVSSTVEGLAKGLHILADDRTTYEEISRNASDMFESRFSVEACAKELLSVLD
jgi:glycosyltransferase involved in cell wall biosynthesis